MTHICITKLTIIDSDNGLLPGWCQAIIWTNVVILLIQTLGTNLNEILREIHTFTFTKMHLKMSSAKQWQFCLSRDVLTWYMFLITLWYKTPFWITGPLWGESTSHWLHQASGIPQCKGSFKAACCPVTDVDELSTWHMLWDGWPRIAYGLSGLRPVKACRGLEKICESEKLGICYEEGRQGSISMG